MTTRAEMIRDQLRARGIRDDRVLAAMAEVPREAFVSAAERAHAYDDSPLPIGYEQTISQPYIVALMTEALKPEPTDRVLEVGTGSGYSAAVLSHLVHRVYTIERIPELAESAAVRLAALGYFNVEVKTGDGSLGWPEHAPYDAIVVTACGPFVPEPLIDQLAVGGRLVMPIARDVGQHLIRVTKVDDLRSTVTDLGPVSFVPLIGEQAWSQPTTLRS